MTADAQLLREYAEAKSQDAFTELVRRHLDLVYSAGLRQVHSPQLAEEISQSVFADLARAADKLTPDTILTAWLYQVTRRTAIDVIRRESRRQARERIAVEMAAMNTAADWNHIAPLLEDAMEALDETDRAAILLRYFENKSLREVGQSLGTSDDAAQKRVSRAVDRLREFFSQRGVAVGAGGLVVLISTNAVQAAPLVLAGAISSAVILTGATVPTAITATKAIAMSFLQKTAVAVALAAAIATGVYKARQVSQLRDQMRTLEQEKTSLITQLQQLREQQDGFTASVSGLQKENDRLKNDTAELLKLRAQIASLRNNQYPANGSRTNQSAAALPDSSESTAANIKIPKSSWTNAGFATPENALQTRGWSVLNGDRERFKDSVYLTDGARKLIEDMILKMGAASTDPDKAAALQAAVNNNWGAEEAILMPLMALNKDKGFTGYEILSEQSPSEDEKILEVETQMTSAPAQKETLKFHRFGNDWRVVIDENFIKSVH